ncbi:MAG TPA: hypothetical protein DCS87_13315, partial [Rheinheimera sp.]|nr:hypothetical protein [Rheinheimera sp.]
MSEHMSSNSKNAADMPKTSMTTEQNSQDYPAPVTVLLLGASGQIGRCMVAELSRLWPKARLLTPSREQLDLTTDSAVLGYLQQTQPDWLINCAAFTAVDAAEQDPQFAGVSVDTHPNFCPNVETETVDTHPNVETETVDTETETVDTHPN